MSTCNQLDLQPLGISTGLCLKISLIIGSTMLTLLHYDLFVLALHWVPMGAHLVYIGSTPTIVEGNYLTTNKINRMIMSFCHLFDLMIAPIATLEVSTQTSKSFSQSGATRMDAANVQH